MSKGSTNSTIIPLYFTQEIIDIAKLIRLRKGGITISRRYTKFFNVNPNFIINKIISIFDILPSYTSKNEPIFCSGVLEIFFSKIINKKSNQKTELPTWYQKLN